MRLAILALIAAPLVAAPIETSLEDVLSPYGPLIEVENDSIIPAVGFSDFYIVAFEDHVDWDWNDLVLLTEDGGASWTQIGGETWYTHNWFFNGGTLFSDVTPTVGANFLLSTDNTQTFDGLNRARTFSTLPPPPPVGEEPLEEKQPRKTKDYKKKNK